MADQDLLHRFLFEHTSVRGEYLRLDASWKAVLARRDYPQVVRDLLGQALVASMLLGATIKFRGSLILQIQGDGPVSMLVAQVTAERTMRGTAEWEGEIAPGSLQDLFGSGHLAITIDPGEGRERYQGIVELGEGGLADALANYFDRSEQLATRLWLAADDEHAAGLLLQQLPGEDPDPDAWNRTLQLGATVTDEELLALPFRDLLWRLYHEEDVRVFEPEPVSFRCRCSRERIEEVLRSLGHDEVGDIVAEQGKVSVQCSFCGLNYEFDPVDAEGIFAAEHPPRVPKTKH